MDKRGKQGFLQESHTQSNGSVNPVDARPVDGGDVKEGKLQSVVEIEFAKDLTSF